MGLARHGWLCLGLWGAMSACTSGIATPIDRLDAGFSANSGSGGQPQAGRAGHGGGGVSAGASAGSGGAGAPGNMTFQCPFEPPENHVAESEEQMRKLLLEAIQTGELCVEPTLRYRADFRCVPLGAAAWLATNPPPPTGPTPSMGPNTPRRSTSLLPPSSEGWNSTSWLGYEAESATEAKSQMFSENMLHSDGYRMFCEAASRDHYTSFAVGRWVDSWAVQFFPSN
jgi:hypothetical protein